MQRLSEAGVANKQQYTAMGFADHVLAVIDCCPVRWSLSSRRLDIYYCHVKADNNQRAGAELSTTHWIHSSSRHFLISGGKQPVSRNGTTPISAIQVLLSEHSIRGTCLLSHKRLYLEGRDVFCPRSPRRPETLVKCQYREFQHLAGMIWLNKIQ